MREHPAAHWFHFEQPKWAKSFDTNLCLVKLWLLLPVHRSLRCALIYECQHTEFLLTRFQLTDLPFISLFAMKNAPVKGLEVFDFTEEDELPELISEKRLSKFKNPNLESNAVLKYEFLECGRSSST